MFPNVVWKFFKRKQKIERMAVMHYLCFIISGILLINVLLFWFSRKYKNEFRTNWPKSVLDISVLVISLVFAIIIFYLESDRNKKDEMELFKRNFAVLDFEATNNGSELRILKLYLEKDHRLPSLKPHLSFDISKSIISNPLIFKYSASTLQYSFSQYKTMIEVANSYFDNLYNPNPMNILLDSNQIRNINYLIERTLQKISIFEIIAHFYEVGYNANILGPEISNHEIIFQWLSGKGTPSVDSLNNILEEIDKINPKDLKDLQENMKDFLR